MLAPALPARALRGPAVARASAGRGDPVKLALAWSLVACYSLWASLPSFLYPEDVGVHFYRGEILCILLACAYTLVCEQLRPRRILLVPIAATALSLVGCEDKAFAGTRWAAWVVLLLAVGPINRSAAATVLRSRLFTAVIVAVLIATTLSAAWWLAQMPNLGRGDFTGVLRHSMILAPVAALSGVWSLLKLIERRSAFWGAFYVLSLAVTLLASSRSALVALAFASLIAFVLQLRRHAILGVGVVLIAAVFAMASDSFGWLLSDALPDQFTTRLFEKGLNNSRDLHWEARWDEFTSSPINGVGFAYGWLNTPGFDEERGSVEAGSSYLAVLSMTGIAGACGLACLPLAGVVSYYRSRRTLPRSTRRELLCLAGFWFVHLGAEGYIYAVGSLMGVIFWVWVGRAFDAFDAAGRARARRPQTGGSLPPRAGGSRRSACPASPCS